MFRRGDERRWSRDRRGDDTPLSRTGADAFRASGPGRLPRPVDARTPRPTPTAEPFDHCPACDGPRHMATAPVAGQTVGLALVCRACGMKTRI